MVTPSESQPSSDRLALLYRLSQTFNSSLDLAEVLNRVMDEVITATRAERGFVMLLDEQKNLIFHVARGIEQTTIDAPQFQVSRSIVENVARTAKPVMTSDAQKDDRFSMRQSVVMLGLRSILCVPLLAKEKMLGIIYVDNRLQVGLFTPADFELLTAIAASAAIAIENARLYQVAVEKGRLERELQMARRVQTSLLPAETPQLAGWEFAAKWLPAREVAGDYYDFLPNEAGRLGMVIADVTDKGLAAALFMAFTRTVLRATMVRAPSPAEAITQANRVICDDSISNLYVTLFYGCLEPHSGEFTYVNAGHNPPLLYRTDRPGELTELTRTGMLIGVDRDHQYQQATLYLQEGDFILFYTDGVTESINPAGEDFKVERLKKLVMGATSFDSDRLLHSILSALDTYTQSATPFDDITLMALKRTRL